MARLTAGSIASYLAIPDAAALTLPDGDWSALLLVKITPGAQTGNVYKYLLSRLMPDAPGSLNVWLGQASAPENAGKIIVSVGDDGGTALRLVGGDYIPDIGTWVAIGVERAGGSLNLYYKSGTPVATAPHGFTVGHDPAAPLYFGKRSDDHVDRTAPAAFADFALWSGAFPAGQFAAFATFASRARDFASGRLGLWEFATAGPDEATTPGPTEPEYSGGQAATVAAATLVAGPTFGGGGPAAPTIASIDSPATGSAVAAGTRVQLLATLGGGAPDTVAWYRGDPDAGGALLASTNPYLYDTTGRPNGSETLFVRATNAGGSAKSSRVLTIGAAGASASSSSQELRTMCDLYHRDADANRRRVPLYLTLADGSPAPAAAAKVKIIKNGGDVGDSNANVAAIANAGAGWFFVQLTAADLDTPGSLAVAYDDGTARGRTLCAVLPLPSPVAGAVTAATDAANLTVPAGLRLRAGWVFSITEGAGEGGSAVVASYNAATGAVVLEEPGLPVLPGISSRFTATASPAGATMPATDANGRVQAVGIDTLLARVPAEVATDADVQSITTSLAGGVTLAGGQAAGIANAVLDMANGVETNMTPRQALRLLTAILGGAVTGAGTSEETFKAAGGNKVRATVTADPQGNRTLVFDLSA